MTSADGFLRGLEFCLQVRRGNQEERRLRLVSTACFDVFQRKNALSCPLPAFAFRSSGQGSLELFQALVKRAAAELRSFSTPQHGRRESIRSFTFMIWAESWACPNGPNKIERVFRSFMALYEAVVPGGPVVVQRPE